MERLLIKIVNSSLSQESKFDNTTEEHRCDLFSIRFLLGLPIFTVLFENYKIFYWITLSFII